MLKVVENAQKMYSVDVKLRNKLGIKICILSTIEYQLHVEKMLQIYCLEVKIYFSFL